MQTSVILMGICKETELLYTSTPENNCCVEIITDTLQGDKFNIRGCTWPCLCHIPQSYSVKCEMNMGLYIVLVFMSVVEQLGLWVGLSEISLTFHVSMLPGY